MTPTETISVMSLKKLTDLFRETFEDESLVLRPDLTAQDVEKWDSFNKFEDFTYRNNEKVRIKLL